MKVYILESAKDQLEEGFRFYERQSPGLGMYFLNSLFADIDSLSLYGGVHSIVFGYHRCLAKRFPFAIYYLSANDEVRVFAVLDCRRKPSSIWRALREK